MDIVALLVATLAGLGNGAIVKASQGGSHPVLWPGVYEGACVVGGAGLGLFGAERVGTGLMCGGAALLSQRLASRVVPGQVAAGYAPNYIAPPLAPQPRGPQPVGSIAYAYPARVFQPVGSVAYARPYATDPRALYPVGSVA
jgi:hypothetical protein